VPSRRSRRGGWRRRHREVVSDEAGDRGPATLDDRARRRLRAFAFRLTGDAHAAEDVAQETLAKVLAGGVPRDWPYLFGIALNLVRTGARRRRGLPTAELQPDRVADRGTKDPLDALAAAEESRRFWERLGRLPEKERQALVLRFSEGLSCDAIGRTLGLTPNAVSCLLHRAKERMRSLMPEGSRQP
jgi:RNA polymerase sigma-70 factor (ECF subfamily)